MSSPNESDIPRDYYSEYEERPFRSCTRCGEALASIPEGYQVVKHWQNGEVTHEYAVCDGCHQKLLAEISQESRERMEAFHAENFHANLGRERCAVCAKHRDEIKQGEFSLTGIFHGGSLSTQILICSDCTEHMQSLMSEKTRGVWERFIKENFPTAPEDSLPEPTYLLSHEPAPYSAPLP